MRGRSEGARHFCRALEVGVLNRGCRSRVGVASSERDLFDNAERRGISSAECAGRNRSEHAPGGRGSAGERPDGSSTQKRPGLERASKIREGARGRRRRARDDASSSRDVHPADADDVAAAVCSHGYVRRDLDPARPAPPTTRRCLPRFFRAFVRSRERRLTFPAPRSASHDSSQSGTRSPRWSGCTHWRARPAAGTSSRSRDRTSRRCVTSPAWRWSVRWMVS